MKNKLLYATLVAIICFHPCSIFASAPAPAPDTEKIAKLKIAYQKTKKSQDSWRKDPEHQETIKLKTNFFQAIDSINKTPGIDKGNAYVRAGQELLHSIKSCPNPAERLTCVILSIEYNKAEHQLENNLHKAMLEESQSENAKLKAQLAALTPEAASK